MMMTRLLFFGRLRDRIGTAEMEVSLPPKVKTGADLITWLSEQDKSVAKALNDKSVRLAIDLAITDRSADVANAREIAFLPPMSGG